MVAARPVSWLPFRVIALSLAMGTMGATMASPLFPFYADLWGLAASSITIVFVSYMIGVMAAFLFLGRLTDRLGPVPVLRAALLLILGGLSLSATAGGLGSLIAARFAIGIASGMVTTSATVGLVAFEPAGAVRRAPLIASMTTMAGFGLGPLVAGVAAQLAASPLVTPYLVVLAPTALVFGGLLAVRTAGSRRNAEAGGARTVRLSLMPRLVLPDREALPGFLVASFAVFTAYGLFSLLASLAPTFLKDLLPWHGPAVSGVALATVLFCSAGVQFPARRLEPKTGLRMALSLMGTGVILLGLSLGLHIAPLFFAADLSIGLGHGLAFMSGIAIVDRISGEHNRGGLLSSFLSIGYLGTIAPILAVGFLSDAVGVANAVIAFCAVSTLSTAFLLSTARLVPVHARAG